MGKNRFRRWMGGRAWVFVVILSIAILGLLLQGCSSAEEGLAVGDSAPAFTLPEADGGTVSLADYEGSQPVLLFFHMADG